MSIYLGTDEIDPTSLGGDNLEAIYIGADKVWEKNSAPTGFYDYVEVKNLSNYRSQFATIVQNLGYARNPIGFSLQQQGGVTNGNMLIVGGGAMSAENWQPVPLGIAFVITKPNSGIIDDYFVSDISNTCEYSLSGGYAYYNMWKDLSSWNSAYPGISSTCTESIDDIVAHLYAGRI